MDVSVIGASGDCGREVAIQLIRDRVLEPRQILQLVAANPDSDHPHLLRGFRADLQDAYAEIVPELDVTDDPGEIIGDVVVMAAGRTFATDPRKVGEASRDTLARANLRVFERFADAMARTRGDSPPVVIVVTNPVELGVHVFASRLPRDHVIGMGAYSDSLRFRWEIAHDLGLRRQVVHGYVLGEHGAGMVPLWSTVKVQGMDDREWALWEPRLRRGVGTAEFPSVLVAERERLASMLADDPVAGPEQALRHVATLAPDLRVALKPFAIHYTEAKTVVATAHSTVELVKCIMQGRPMEIAAQYQHCGESGINGPFGPRLIVAGTVERLLPVEGYLKEETDRIAESARLIQRKIGEWTSDAG